MAIQTFDSIDILSNSLSTPRTLLSTGIYIDTANKTISVDNNIAWMGVDYVSFISKETFGTVSYSGLNIFVVSINVQNKTVSITSWNNQLPSNSVVVATCYNGLWTSTQLIYIDGKPFYGTSFINKAATVPSVRTPVSVDVENRTITITDLCLFTTDGNKYLASPVTLNMPNYNIFCVYLTYGTLANSLAAHIWSWDAADNTQWTTKATNAVPPDSIVLLSYYQGTVSSAVPYTTPGRPDEEKPWANKKVLFLGDSITRLSQSERGWPGKFFTSIEGAKYVNVAVNGARWCNYDDTVLDGNPVFDGADNNHNNVICNQVEKISRGKDTSNPNYSHVSDYDSFDVIVISAGTNDVNSTTEKSGMSTQFYNGSTVVSIDDLDLTTWAGAMRYTYQKMRGMYPTAKIFICSPIQGAQSIRPYNSIKEKRDLIIEICNRISDYEYVDTFNCGVFGIYEIANANGRDLIDGLHPNVSGANKIAEYNAHAVKQFFIGR